VRERTSHRLEEAVRNIYQVVKEKENRFKDIENMMFTEEDKMSFASATTCHICGSNLCKKRGGIFIADKVRDHCHLTGKYRGAAHAGCNLIYQVPKFIPIFFHNLSVYDSHLFI